MKEKIVTLLAALGYRAFSESDEIALYFASSKVEQDIKNKIHWEIVPPELEYVWLYRVLGEFLLQKKTFAPSDLSMLDLSGTTVKQIQAGDTSFTLDGGATADETRLSSFINSLCDYGANQFAAFRKIRW